MQLGEIQCFEVGALPCVLSCIFRVRKLAHYQCRMNSTLLQNSFWSRIFMNLRFFYELVSTRISKKREISWKYLVKLQMSNNATSEFRNIYGQQKLASVLCIFFLCSDTLLFTQVALYFNLKDIMHNFQDVNFFNLENYVRTDNVRGIGSFLIKYVCTYVVQGWQKRIFGALEQSHSLFQKKLSQKRSSDTLLQFVPVFFKQTLCYCSKLSFCQNDPPIKEVYVHQVAQLTPVFALNLFTPNAIVESFWQKDSLL